MDDLLASPGSPGQDLLAVNLREEPAFPVVEPDDLLRSAPAQPSLHPQDAVLTLDCPRFERQIAPDSLYFPPDEPRRVHFSTTVEGIEYVQDPAERPQIEEQWPVEDDSLHADL